MKITLNNLQFELEFNNKNIELLINELLTRPKQLKTLETAFIIEETYKQNKDIWNITKNDLDNLHKFNDELFKDIFNYLLKKESHVLH